MVYEREREPFLRAIHRRILQRNNWFYWYDQSQENPAQQARLRKLLEEREKK